MIVNAVSSNINQILKDKYPLYAKAMKVAVIAFLAAFVFLY